MLPVSQCVHHIPVPKKSRTPCEKMKMIAACHICFCSSFWHNVVLIFRCVGSGLDFGDSGMRDRLLRRLFGLLLHKRLLLLLLMLNVRGLVREVFGIGRIR